jgi:DNA-binding transcriptional MocR family regulator
VTLESRTGYVWLHRAARDSDQWKMSSDGFKVWLDILLSANIHADEWYSRRRKKLIPVPRGAFVTTQRALAKSARVGRQVVRTALEQLSAMGAISTQQVTHGFTLIEVVNFNLYQAEEPKATQDLAHAQPTPNPGSKRREVEKKNLGARARNQNPDDWQYGLSPREIMEKDKLARQGGFADHDAELADYRRPRT